MKKKIISLVMALALCAGLAVPAFATTNLGTLSYWYSDSEQIGRWNKSSIDIYTVKLNSYALFSFTIGMNHACNQWEDVTGMTLSKSSSSSFASAPIQYYGGTADELNATGEFTVPSTANGYTARYIKTEGTWTYGRTQKEGCLIDKALGFIVDKDHTADEYKNTCTHELGHALGWFGHSNNNSDIMYAYGNSVTSLTTRDKNHISQVYR